MQTLGNITLHNADCMDLLRQMPDKSVDFILTDIPYEIEIHGGGKFSDRGMVGGRGKVSTLEFVSKGIDYDKVFPEFERILKVVNGCIFCSNRQVSKIMSWWQDRGYSTTLLVWDKPNPIPLCNGKYIDNLEFIVYVRDKGATYNNLGYNLQLKTFRYNPPQAKDRIHETEKPTNLLEHLLMLHTNEGDVVFDPYAGSFSTAIACHNLKRKFIGCEILEKYYTRAVKRIQEHQRQLTINF